MRRFFLLLLLSLCVVAHAKKGAAQLDRFDASMKDLRALFESDKPPLEIVDQMLAMNSRIQAFKLEALLKIYEDLYPDMKDFRFETKELVERMGNYADAVNWAKKAAAHGSPAQFQTYMEGEAKVARQEMADFLVQKNWIPEKNGKSVLAKLDKTLKKTEWLSYEDDRQYVEKELTHHLKKLQSTDYNMFDLAGPKGLHKFRRGVRWFLIMVEALNGLVELDDTFNPVKEYEPLLQDPYAKSPYLKIPRGAHEKNPIVLPKAFAIAMVKASETLGDIKDMGEAERIWIPHALVLSGIQGDPEKAMVMAHAWMEKQEGYRPFAAAAKPIYDTIKKSDLLDLLQKAIKEKRIKGATCRRAMTGI